MQTKSSKTAGNRPSQKSYTSARSSEDEVFALAQASIEQALIIHPNLPAIQLAGLLVENSDPELAADLSDLLMREYYARGILAQRREESIETARAQPMLPGFEHLPARIQVGEGKRVRLLSANYAAVREYYRSLIRAYGERRRNDPKLREAKALLDEMQKHSRANKGITVREVVLIPT